MHARMHVVCRRAGMCEHVLLVAFLYCIWSCGSGEAVGAQTTQKNDVKRAHMHIHTHTHTHTHTRFVFAEMAYFLRRRSFDNISRHECGC